MSKWGLTLIIFLSLVAASGLASSYFLVNTPTSSTIDATSQDESNSYQVATVAQFISQEVAKQLALLNLVPEKRNRVSLTASSEVANSTGKVLSVDADGYLILVSDQDTAETTIEETVHKKYTTTTTNQVSLDQLFSPNSGGTLYYTGSTWATSTNFFNNGSLLGVNTTSPLGLLHLNSSDTTTTGLILQGTVGQTAPLFDLLDSSGVSVASMSAKGKLVLGNQDDDHTLELYPVLEIAPGGDAGGLSSNGGALYLNNTRNEGSGINIFSDAGAEADGHLLNIKSNNPAFTKGSIYVEHKGSGNAVNITHNGSSNSANALSITNNNTLDSALGVIGYETGRGTVKITHNGDGSDANASGLSIDVKGTGTAAQGVYVDSTATSGTTGNLMRLRNQSIDRFVVSSLGSLTMGTTGTNTTLTKRGNTAADEFFVGTNGAFRVQRSASDSEAFRVQVSGDTQGRWLGTSDGKLKWGDGTSVQDITLRRSAANTLYLDTARFQIKSPGSNSDLLTFTSSSNTRLGRFIETSGGYGWFEISDNNNVTKILLRADSGSSYLNAGNLAVGATAADARLHVTATTEQLRLSYNGSNHAQFSVNSSGLLTVTPTAALSVASSVGIGTATFGSSAVNTLAIANSTAPSTAITNGIQLFAVDQAGSHELRVMDEASNITTLSPHNFSLIPTGQSEQLAWSFYSERQGLAINADMTRALRLVEDLSGEQLLFIKDLQTNQYISSDTADDDRTHSTASIHDSFVTVGQLEVELDPYLTKAELDDLLSLDKEVIQFFKHVVVQARAVFKEVVEFSAAVIFKGPLTVSSDTAGTATIPAAVTKVRVHFPHAYTQPPVVYLSAQDTTISYQLSEVSETAFTISLTQAQDKEVLIQWLAVMTEGSTTLEVLEHDQTTDDQDPTPTPELSPLPAAVSSAAAHLSN